MSDSNISDLHRLFELKAELAGHLEQKDIPNAARTLGNLGQQHRKLGQLNEALKCSIDALAIFSDLGDRKAQATELLLQANTYGALDNLREALRCHTESLKIADELGEELLVGMNCFRSGLIYLVTGMNAQARILLRYALLIYTKLGETSYAEDVLGTIETFKRSKAFQSDENSLALDAFFGAGPSVEKIARAVNEHPLLLSLRLTESLNEVDEDAIGLRCVGAALKERLLVLSRTTSRTTSRSHE